MNIQIDLNGQSKTVEEGTTLAQLVAQLDLGSARFAVELNGHVVPRAEHPGVTLRPDDALNIVTFVGGG